MKQIVTVGWLVILLLGWASSGWAQQATRRVCDTIPYELIHGKIVIPVKVNGRTVKYIIDTGGRTATVKEEALRMDAQLGLMQAMVSDFNQIGMNYPTATLGDVLFGTSYHLNSLETMVIPNNGFFKELGVAGLLGGDAFAQAVVTFDARQKIIVLNYPYRPDGLKITEGQALYPGDRLQSIVEMDFGGVRKKVLFDTGVREMLVLCEKDYKQAGIPVRKIASSFGINGVGIGGLGEPIASDKVVVEKMNFGGKDFTQAGSITSRMDISIIGYEMLNYGKVIIDYMRSRFYFFPFDPQPAELGGAPLAWNVGVLPVKGRFEVTTVWDSMQGKVELGEEVIRINGTDMSAVAPSQLEVERLLGEKPTALLTLKDKAGKMRQVEIKKE